MSLKRQVHIPHDIALCFNADELAEVAANMAQERGVSVDEEVLGHIMLLTNGHLGAAHALLQALFEQMVDITPPAPARVKYISNE